MGIIPANELTLISHVNPKRWEFKIHLLTNLEEDRKAFIFHERHGEMDITTGYPLLVSSGKGVPRVSFVEPEFKLEGGTGCYKGRIWYFSEDEIDVRIWETPLPKRFQEDIPAYISEDEYDSIQTKIRKSHNK